MLQIFKDMKYKIFSETKKGFKKFKDKNLMSTGNAQFAFMTLKETNFVSYSLAVSIVSILNVFKNGSIKKEPAQIAEVTLDSILFENNT